MIDQYTNIKKGDFAKAPIVLYLPVGKNGRRLFLPLWCDRKPTLFGNNQPLFSAN